MRRNRRTAIVLSATVLLIAIVASWIVFTFLPASPDRPSLIMGCLVFGTICSLVIYRVVTKLPDKRWVRVTASSLFALLVFVPLASTAVSRVTYSSFGFTIYGAIPIPALDITVNRYGVLWFRPKTHQITRTELEALITPEVDVVVVGIGWDSIARLTDDAMLLGDTIELRVLATPDAFALYNKLKAEGRGVVLLAHSTC